MVCILIQAHDLLLADDIRTGLAAIWQEPEFHIDPSKPCDCTLVIGDIVNQQADKPTLRVASQTSDDSDFMRAPVRLFTLVQRLKELAARPHSFQWGDYRLDMAARHWHAPAREPVALTEKEVVLLAYLGQSYPQPVSRDDLLRDVWKYASGADTHTVETHLYRLRQKIEVNPDQPAIVVNNGQGYILGILAA